ncbi:MAG TPA: GGDEF domain-containing protein, partial [Trueperaceae bacterium]|nr:GGDEF domain-containing protein [Trueperaceae bacterium]
MEERTHSPGRATEAFFRTHPQAVVVYDPATLELLAVNPRAAAVFGLPTGPAPGRSLLDLHAGETPAAVARDYASAQTPFLAALNGTPTVRLRGVKGEFQAAVSVFELVYGGKLARMAICAELAGRSPNDAYEEERRALQQRVEYLANHDPVTDLPNRQRFETLLLDALAAARAAKLKVAVLYLELHGFRLIHDAVSQDAADDMLRLAARRLKAVAQSATVARFGTDEFAIVTRPLQDTVDATDIAQRVVSGLVEPVVLEGRSVTFRPRVGVAVFPDH